MIKLLLLAVVPFMTEHRNVAPKTEVTTNFYGSVTGIVDNAYIQSHGGDGVNTNVVHTLVDASFVGGTNAVNLAVTGTVVAATNDIANLKAQKLDDDFTAMTNSVSFTNAVAHVSPKVDVVVPTDIAEYTGKAADARLTGIALTNRYTKAETDAAIEAHHDDTKIGKSGTQNIETSWQPTYNGEPLFFFDLYYWQLNANLMKVPWGSLLNKPTTLSGYGITDAMPLNPSTVSVERELRVGGDILLDNRIRANGWNRFYNMQDEEDLPSYLASGAWNTASDPFAKVSQIPVISETDTTFSNAVLAVGLNIDTNSVAVLNEIAATFGDFPITGTATTVGGLLAALAAAVALLRKKTKLLKSDGTAEDDFATDLLGKPVANAKVRYALATASSATVVDRTVNLLTMTADETLVFQTATTHDGTTYARDFLLKLTYSGGTLQMPTGVTKVGDELSFEAGKTYLIAFTEIAADKFYVRAIDITEAQA